MDEKNMKNYLKDLMELESEKYRLELIKHDIINFEVNELKLIDKKEFVGYKDLEFKKNYALEHLVNVDSIKEPVEPEKPAFVEIKSVGWWAIPLLIFGIIFIICGTFSDEDEIRTIFLGPGILFTCISAIEFFDKAQSKKKYEASWIQYEENLKNYYTAMKKYEIEFKEVNDNYNLKSEKIINEYQEKIKNQEVFYKKKCDERMTALSKTEILKNNLDENLEIIDNKLNELYNLDIIFPKYRNFVAISTIYEYFASSRVVKLDGVDGAYNLYESEMRQNVIIVKLNDILDNLDQIKQNQYCMYIELNKINDSLSNIGNVLKDIEKQVRISNDNLFDLKVINGCILRCYEQINKNINTIKKISVSSFLLK